MSANSRPAPLRIACHTLGCRLNQCDTESILAALREQLAIAVVDWQDDADLYLLNTCTVTAKAAQSCRRIVRQIKHRHPDARVVVAGCYAQVAPAVLAALPQVDAVLGHEDKLHTRRWLPAVLAGRQRPVLVSPLQARGPLRAGPLGAHAGRSRAFLKVQDGCDLRCAYCQIWQARGPARSLPLAAAQAQVRQLHAGAGYHEIVLTGVHLGAWGRDLRPPSSLSSLLAGLCAAAPRVRYRLSSLHPDEVEGELLGSLAALANVRRHLHLSLQSGSDGVLARMGRAYRSDVATAAADGLLRLDPLAGLGADLIAGFPGETDAEFAETLALLEALPLTYLHVFRFSPRPSTPAAAMAPVAPDVVSRRARALRSLGRAKAASFARKLLGQCREGVLERPDPRQPGRRRATLDNYAAVDLVSDLPPGSLVEVRPLAWRDGRLSGEVVRAVREASA